MKKAAVILITILCSNIGLHAQDGGVLPALDLGTKLVGGAVGYAIGKTQEDKYSWAPAAGAAAGVLVADWAAGKWENKQNKDNLDSYMSGMNYQRWIAANKQWHTYTLDPHTGRPPAFAGLTEMDAGMNNAPGAQTKNAKGTNGNNGNNPNSMGLNTDASRPSAITAKVVQVPVVIPAGEHGGVNRSQRTLYFPKLP
jgi:hypothetical protein